MRVSALRPPKISENAVRVMVITLSLVGVSLLVLLGTFTEIDEVEISELVEHNGETVRTSGIVIGQDIRSSGASAILLTDRSGNILEAFVERSEMELEPGSLVSLKGDVYANGDIVSMTVLSDRGIEVEDVFDPVPVSENNSPWTGVSSECIIASVSRSGYDQLNVAAVVYLESGPLFMDMEFIKNGIDIKTGDTVLVKGLMTTNSTICSYGKGSVDLLYRPESASSSLLNLIDRLHDSPSDLPGGKMDISGYIRYEPSYGSFYVGDEPQGSSISLRVEPISEDPALHMGDLVELVNTTLTWDPEGLRYVLVPEIVEVLDPHGPWMLSLSNLEYGMAPYEKAEVVISGEAMVTGNRTYLTDGASRIEMRSDSMIPRGVTGQYNGTVRYDPSMSTHYLLLGEASL